jgi:hypothetical protein
MTVKQNPTRNAPYSSPAANTPPLKAGIRSSVAIRIPESPYSELDIPHLTKTPWELERRMKRSSWRRPKVAHHFAAFYFQNLPKEVYDCIVTQLGLIYLSDERACPSCHMRDLHNLSLVSRAWDKATIPQMYRNIVIVANEEHKKLPKLKIKGIGRLKLLRRTLRERPSLAQCVRELHLSDFQTMYQDAAIEREEIVNAVASLVIACPNLERIVGFHVPYTHAFDRFSHALSTRPNLQERVWLLSDQEDEDDDYEEIEQAGCYLAACDPIERFLELNSHHLPLSRLVLHQELCQRPSLLNFRAVTVTLRQLPSLRHLSISGLAATSFTNLTLCALPPRLQSLRLENLRGIDDIGLQRFLTSKHTTSIERLALVDLELASLETISKVLSPHLASLKYFSFVQQKAPNHSPRTSAPIFCAPLLHCLHWEIRSDADPLSALAFVSPLDSSGPPSFPFTSSKSICCLATSSLADSIMSGGLPSLRRIRIPHDPQGVIQAICRPLATALLPSDTSLFAMPKPVLISAGPEALFEAQAPYSSGFSNQSFATLQSARADSAIVCSDSNTYVPPIFTPARSRLLAHSRILNARKKAMMAVRVFDPNGDLKMDKVVGGFIGSIESKITYDLTPDRSCTLRYTEDRPCERSEWITNIEDLIGEREGQIPVLHERFRGGCGHLISGRVGRDVVAVREMF